MKTSQNVCEDGDHVLPQCGGKQRGNNLFLPFRASNATRLRSNLPLAALPILLLAFLIFMPLTAATADWEIYMEDLDTNSGVYLNTSYTNWPADNIQWVALSNHIANCFQAICERRLSSEEDTANDDARPCYIHPYDDYARFAKAIDDMCDKFVCQTNAPDGSFDNYFSTKRPLNGGSSTGYPTAFPMWTPENLKASCGITNMLGETNWAYRESMRTWMLADHSIQKQVATALNHLIWRPASVTLSNEHYYSWSGYGWAAASTNRCVGGSGSASAIADTSLTPSVRYLPFSPLIVEQTGVIITGGGILDCSRNDWSYLADSVNSSGNVTPTYNWVIWYIRWYETVAGAQDGGWSISASNLVLSAGTNQMLWVALGSNNSLSISELQINNPTPYVTVSRANVAYLVGTTDPSSDATTTKELYLHGGDLNYPTNWDPSTCVWSSEIPNLVSGKYQRIYVATGPTINPAIYDVAAVAGINMPNYSPGGFNRKGWSVDGTLALEKWISLPQVPELESTNSCLGDPDTDRDGIVDIGIDDNDLAVGTGTFVFDDVTGKPRIIIPLSSPPKWCGEPNVHIYLTEHASGRLPYEYLGYDGARDQECDGDGFNMTLNVLTRVLETYVCTNGQTRIKRTALLRPSGNVVLFDFPWIALSNSFSKTGFPVGPNTNRTYVLREETRLSRDEDDYYTADDFYLEFESGLTHVYSGMDLGGDSEDCVCVLQKVTYVDGRSAPMLAFVRWPTLNEYSNQVSTSDANIAFSSDEGSTVPIYASDTKHNMTLTWENGLVQKLIYTTKDGSCAITTEIQRAQDRSITGLVKTGIPGIEKSNVSIEGGTIKYSWGNVTCQQDGPAGTARTLTINTEEPAGTIMESQSFDANDRITSYSITANNGTAPTCNYEYFDSGTDRYTNGFPKMAKLKKVTYADGSWSQFEYDPTNGWLINQTMPVDDTMTREIDYKYDSANGGDVANPTNFVERPRSTVTKVSGTVVDKTLCAYFGADKTVVQQCRTADADWNDTQNLTNTLFFCDGLLTSAVYPAGSDTYTRDTSTSTGKLITTLCRSTGETITNIVNAFGLIESSVIVESNQVTGSAVSTVDPFGRILRTDYLDGTHTGCDDYTLFGPQTVTEIDGSTTTYVYNDLGQVTKKTQSSLGLTTDYEYDTLGNVTKTTVTGSDGASVTTEATYDALGRIVSSKNPLGTTTYTYENESFGTRKTITPPFQSAAVTEDTYFDGSLKEISGSGATSLLRNKYLADSGQLCRQEIRVGSGDSESEYTQTYYDMLGNPCKTVRSGVSGNTAILYDSAARQCGSIDEENVARISVFNAQNRVDRSGTDVDHDGDLKEGSNDRMQSYTRVVGAAGIQNDVSVYPAFGSSGKTTLSSSCASFDGKQTSSTYAGRTATSHRGDYQAGGSYTSSEQASDGTTTRTTYDKW